MVDESVGYDDFYDYDDDNDDDDDDDDDVVVVVEKEEGEMLFPLLNCPVLTLYYPSTIPILSRY